MLKFLLPRQLVNKTATDSAVTPYGGALHDAFTSAYPLVKQAAWWSLPISLFGLLPSIFTLQVYDRVIGRSGYSTLVALLAGIFVFLLIELWLRNKRSRSLRDAGAIVDHGVSNALLQSMLQRPLRMLESRPATAWFLLFRDVGAVRATVTGGLMTSIFDMPVALFALVIIGMVAWPLLPVLLLFLGVLAFFAWWWADEVRAGRVEEVLRGRSLDQVTSEICRARETLKSLGHNQPVVAMWQQNYNAWLSESFRKNGEIERARELTTVMLSVFSVVVVSVGALAVMQQWMTVGGLIAASMLSSKALSPVAGLASNWRSLATATEAAKRLENVFNEPTDRRPGGIVLPKPRGAIRLQEVSFQFNENSASVLENVNLEIGPGGLHVIVGKNGAGKSTLVKLVAGLYSPTNGKISVDEYDLSQFAREELVQWISILSQEVYLFGGELIEILRRAAPDQTDERIVAACRLSGAHDFISRLPAGYRTVLGEGGMGLSMGERRKLALAQLFLRDPAVVILDEPSNDLDYQAETALIAALMAAARSRTIIVVTHSLRIVASASQVHYVTGAGNVESGSASVMVPKLFGVKLPAPAATAAISAAPKSSAPAEPADS
ncbi:MAG: ATP-binding cassette domain-containing protein [Pseudomonadota bacterium]